jgi:hypothetical protein
MKEDLHGHLYNGNKEVGRNIDLDEETKCEVV